MNDIHYGMTLADAANIAREEAAKHTGDVRAALTMLADRVHVTPPEAIDAVLSNPKMETVEAPPSPDTPHGCTVGGIPARYLHGPGRYHAFALDARHLYEIGCWRKDALTTACFKIDGKTVASAVGANFTMMRRGIKAMAQAIMVYKAKSHRNSKEWRKRKRAAAKAAKEGGAK